MSKLQEKPSALKREHSALKKKLINFIRNPDSGTYPETPFNPEPIRIRIHSIGLCTPVSPAVLTLWSVGRSVC
jgi:hypothetical protein